MKIVNVKSILISLGLALIVIPGLWLFILIPSGYERRKNNALAYIEVVDEYKRVNGYLPTDSGIWKIWEAKGLKTSMGCPCYERLTSDTYKVWIQGPSLGSSFIFNSETKKWTERG